MTNSRHCKQTDSGWGRIYPEDWAAMAVFWLLAIIVLLQFLSRHLFASPLGWTEEIARYLLVLLAFVGIIAVARRNTHIFIQYFHRWLPARLSHYVLMTVGLFNAVMLCCLAFFAWQIQARIGIHMMASLPISISYLYLVLLLCLACAAARSVEVLLKTRGTL